MNLVNYKQIEDLLTLKGGNTKPLCKRKKPIIIETLIGEGIHKMKVKQLREYIKKNRKTIKGGGKLYKIGGCKKCDLLKLALELKK
jgi:hypothetical protein